jgi:hypothetical protein
MNAIAKQRTVLDLIEEYDEKNVAIEAAIADLEAAFGRLEYAATVQGHYAGSVGNRPHLHASTLKKLLLKSGWKAVYDRLQIDKLATAKDKKLFDRTIEDPPELTFDNAKATFGDYLTRPRFHILRGLAEVFADLDPAYKSHSKVKIGVKGLPKRVIIGWGEYSHSYGRDKFRDIVNALAAYRGEPHITPDEFSAISAAHSAGEDAVLDGRKIAWKDRYREGEYETLDRGLTIRRFANGNAHVFFAPATLLDINRALAEFYGEVLPDAEEDDAPKRASTAISKDLAFYWTPQTVIDRALEIAGIYHPNQYSRNEAPEYRVLEPSCGDGRILDELRARRCRPLGVEVHTGRAAEARSKGHSVVCANFLEQPAKEEFDFVVMNPPFVGRHYIKHVHHAMKFLKPGGVLVSILPATAHYDHQELKGEWSDLPVGSFAEAGTNVPTGILKIRKAKA